MRIAIALALVVACAGARGAQAPAPGAKSPLVLQLAIHLYQGEKPMGSPSSNGATGSLSGSDAVSGYLWLSPDLCLISAGRTEPVGTKVSDGKSFSAATNIPGAGWFVSGRVLSRDGDEVKVHVEWERRWDRSVRLTNGPKGSQDLTLHPGDRRAFDGVGPSARGSCRATAGRLEAAVVPMPGRSSGR